VVKRLVDLDKRLWQLTKTYAAILGLTPDQFIKEALLKQLEKDRGEIDKIMEELKNG